MADVDFSELKLKLMASIVAISAIKLLEAFMDVGHDSDRDLAWQTGVLAAFVVSAAAARARRPDRPSRQAAGAERAALFLQHHAPAFGRQLRSVSGGLGLASGSTRGCSASSVNHQSSDLSQPSPGGTGSCGWHAVSPAGQTMRMWK